MTSEADLIRLLSDGQRTGARTIDATTLSDLDRVAAYRVLAATRSSLSEATGMLIDQLRLSIASEQQAEIVEPGDDALQLDAVHEENRDRDLLLPNVIEKRIL